MKNPDVLFFFDAHPHALALYQALEGAVLAAFPDTEIRVQKTQVSFYCRRMFACASLPRKKAEGYGRDYLLLTLGLPGRLDSPRVMLSTEPYPGRWTTHIPLLEPGDVDKELLGWICDAYGFSSIKR